LLERNLICGIKIIAVTPIPSSIINESTNFQIDTPTALMALVMSEPLAK
jgi:hypothetical protein